MDSNDIYVGYNMETVDVKPLATPFLIQICLV